MTPDTRFEQLVETWLAEAAPAGPPASLHAAVAQRARHTRQRRPAFDRPWRQIIGDARLAVALAAGVVIALAAFNLLTPRNPATGSDASPSATASSTETLGEVSRSFVPFRELPLDLYGDYRQGRQFLTVDAIHFSVSIPAYRWRPYPNVRDAFLIGKRDDLTYGPPGLIFWAAFPEGDRATSCLDDNGGGDDTARDVAEAIAAAPGTTLETPPTELTIGGRPAAYVSVLVGDDPGCDPAFVYDWQPRTAGIPWYQMAPGDTVRAWIVEVDGRLLFIGALTRGPTYGTAYLPGLAAEIESIVSSLRFE